MRCVVHLCFAVQDDALIQALDDDSYWGEDDVAAYRRRLLEAADPQLRQAVNTWWQVGIFGYYIGKD